MWDRSDFYIRIAFGRFGTTDVVCKANIAIDGAIVAGDPKTAEEETRHYLGFVGGQTAKRLRKTQNGLSDNPG